MKSLSEITLLLVDDDPLYLKLVIRYLESIGISAIHSTSKYQEAVEKVRKKKFDVALLDIRLDASNKNLGVELAEELKTIRPNLPVIFLTSLYNEEVYGEARLTQPSSFLSKDLSRLKLLQSIESALVQSEKEQTSGNNTPQEGQILFKVGHTYKVISLDKISHFYSEQKNIFGQVGDRMYPVEVSLKTLEEQLFPRFLRVHKANLVNRTYISSIDYRDNKVILTNGHHLPIGYAYRKKFFSALNIIH